MNWIDCKEQLPEPFEEVLVLIDGHRSPMWRNNYALVAYRTLAGNWFEQQHWTKEPLQCVMKWAAIEYPQ